MTRTQPVRLRSSPVAVDLPAAAGFVAASPLYLGAQLIVYQTASSTFQGTSAQPQHDSFGAIRAVETGRAVLASPAPDTVVGG